MSIELQTEAVLLATSKLDAAERLNATLLEALKLARQYVAKMDADGVNTVIPPSNALRVIDGAIAAAKTNGVI